MKIGILGLGSIGTRHAHNLAALGHETVVFDPAWCEAKQRDFVIKTSDALLIASPTSQHYQDLFDCMLTRKPIFVEKPIAATREELGRLQGFDIKRVFVGYNLRFHPCVRWVRECLNDDAIGDVLHAAFVCAQRSAKYKDDLVLNWSHEIDLAYHLFGDGLVDHVCGAGDDRIDLMLWHDDGMRSHIYLNYVTIPQARAFQVIGTRGHIRVDLAGGMIETADQDGGDKHFFPADSFDKSYLDEMKAFLDHIEGNATIGTTGEDGLAVLKLCLDARGA